MQKVRMNLEGINGNAFALLGAFTVFAREQGWNNQAISEVVEQAMDGDYDHLLRTLGEHTEIAPEEADA